MPASRSDAIANSKRKSKPSQRVLEASLQDVQPPKRGPGRPRKAQNSAAEPTHQKISADLLQVANSEGRNKKVIFRFSPRRMCCIHYLFSARQCGQQHWVPSCQGDNRNGVPRQFSTASVPGIQRLMYVLQSQYLLVLLRQIHSRWWNHWTILWTITSSTSRRRMTSCRP